MLDAPRVAHSAGVVHRELKPQSIVLGVPGRALVMDFGIAARVRDGADGRVAGTRGYMSPDAVIGERTAPPTDALAAGSVLFEILADRLLVAKRDPCRAIHRVAQEDGALPAALSVMAGDPSRTSRRGACKARQRPALGCAIGRCRTPRPPRARARSTSCCGGCGTGATSPRCRTRPRGSRASRTRSARTA
jgi:eukaryotic-like serine/threonine-protein kinase